MPLNFKDTKVDFFDFINNSKLINDIFTNTFVLSLMTVIIILIIVLINFKNNIYINSNSIIVKIILYSTIITTLFNISHDNILKKKYKSTISDSLSEEFNNITKIKI